MRHKLPLSERFWPKVEKTDGCWLWTANTRPNGYGLFGSVGAHRVAYELCVGPIPSGMYVCHRCDNPACVRPDHLFVGTQLDNMRDMVTKGRGRQPGECCRAGHPFSAENTAVDPKSGKRRCRACHAERGKQARATYDRSKYETYDYRRAMYLKHRDTILAKAHARYHMQTGSVEMT